MSATTSAPAAGRALYHAAWEMVGRKFFDVSRLTNWADWEHKFDSEIDSEETALRFISQMVASLGDSYTHVVGAALSNAVPASVATADATETTTASAVPASQSDVLTRKLKGNVGYIRIFSFEQPDIVEQVTEGAAAIADCDAFIIDLRDNNGGEVNGACNCSEFFIEQGPIGSIARRLPDGRMWHRDVGLVDEAIVFITKVTGEEDRVEGFLRRKPITAGKPVVVLINEGTASSAEMVAAAIVESDKESGLVTCMGEPSFGKGIAQGKVSVMDKVVIQVTMAHFMSPSDVWFGDAQQTVRNPVMPDIHVSSKTEAGPNAQLEAAFKHLQSRLAPAA